MTRPLLVAGAALALLLAAPSRAADDVAEARAHFDQGSKLYRAGKYRDAIVEFEAAYRLKPHGAIHYNVAQCREKLEHWPEALRSYQDYLREVPDARDRAAVRATMGRIERRLAAAGVQALLVYSDPPGAAIRIDGKPRGRTPYHVALAPGIYRLSLALSGYEPEEQEVEVSMAGTRLVDVVLRSRAVATPVGASTPATPLPVAAAPTPAQPASPPASGALAPDLAARPPASPVVAVTRAASDPVSPPAKRRVYTWVAAGVAVAAGAAGVAYGVAASRQADKLRDGFPHADAAALASGAQSKATTANVLYGISGVAAAAGVTLFFVEGKF
jgi:PEGA domain